MRVGAIGPKLDGHGTEDAELARHLVHPTQGPLLIGVRKLDHQTGRGTLVGQMFFSTRSVNMQPNLSIYTGFSLWNGIFIAIH